MTALGAGALLSVATVLSAAPQGGVGEPSPLETFRALSDTDKSVVIRGVERRIMLDPDDAIQAIVSMQRSFKSFPEGAPRQFHDPRKWAKGVAPKRVLRREGTPEHDRVLAAAPPVPFLPGLHKAVYYDWGAGRIVRRKRPLSDDEVFDNLLQGFPPGSDVAVARVLKLLDVDPKKRKIAAYLEHLYADLDASVYENITLYQAWYGGKILDVPDVDAIPFAIQILKTRSYVSPIPKGRRRTRLYQRIRDHTFSYRKYRTLREAAAAAFVRAEPVLEGDYALLVPRFHYLYATEDNDPKKVAELLGKLPDREAFIRKMDGAVQSSQAAYERREGRKNGLTAMADKIRDLALAALARRPR